MKIENSTIHQLMDRLAQMHKQVTLSHALSERDKKTTDEMILTKVLQKQQEELQIMLDSVPAMIFYKNKENRMLRVNRAFVEAMGMPKEAIEGKTCSELWPEQAEKYWGDDKEVMLLGRAKRGIVEPLETVKGTRWVETDKIPCRDENDDIIGVTGFAIDITERRIATKALQESKEKLKLLNKQLKMSNRKLSRLALKDPQTGLYNHRYFEEIIESEFYRAKRHGQPLSLIMLDIDYFKSVNEVYGHGFGDLVLRQFSKKLRKLVRLHDYVIRYGDEEFVVVLPGSDRASTLRMGQRILDFIKTHSFGDGKNDVKLRLSVAVVSYPEDDSIFKEMDFIEIAERVLNMVKECGGDRVCSSSDIKGDIFPEDREYRTTDIKFMKQRLLKITRESNQSLTESIFAFAKTIELKDRYTGGHVENTVYYATEIARGMGLAKTDTRLVEQASILHDLGKIGISENILLKRGKLTKFEFEKIKEHPKIGVDIIRPIQFLRGLVPLILYHHERWDGKGYPCGLKGEEIPVGARIIAIADVYQALISDRPYRKAFSEHEAIGIIKENSGTQFDPAIVDAFLEILLKKNSNPSKLR
ncbi:MAG: diguanylate cyclase [Candidatus Omnitrophica bacterium]|nr:diguanylate cyclase [Candidatus Omnitrophota bacterium]